MIETFIKALSEKCLQAISQSARKTTINITFNTIYTRILTYYITLHPTKNFGVVQQSKPAKFNIYTPPTLAGFFFCPAAIQPNTNVYSAFCSVHASYTTHAAKQRTGLHRRFSCDLSNSTALYTRPAKADIMPPAPRWSVSQRRSTSSAYQIQASRRTLYRSAQTAYYNNVYKGAPAGTLHPAGQSSGGRRGTIGGSRRISFSGFRPIANRSQQ